MAAGGTEKYLQTIAMLLPKDKFEVDFFYTVDAPFIRSGFIHPPNDPRRRELVEASGVKVIEVHVDAKIGYKEPYEWVNTDLWDRFDESNYDFIVSARGGYPEYPFNLINDTKIIDTIHSFTGEDKPNICQAILLCDWQRDKWAENGGNRNKGVVIPTVVKVPGKKSSQLRKKLEIPEDGFVYGFHQGNREEIFSPVSLQAYNHIKHSKNYFLIMGGAQQHRQLASQIDSPNIKFIEHCSSVEEIHDFLGALDVFAHARSDGEVCSAAIIEALYHGLPVISHPALNMGHAEQIDGCGYMVSTINEYAQRMLDYEKDQSLLEEHSKKALKKYNENYDYHLIEEKIINVFNSLI